LRRRKPVKNNSSIVKFKGIVGIAIFIIAIVSMKVMTVHDLYSDEWELVGVIFGSIVILSLVLAKDYMLTWFKI